MQMMQICKQNIYANVANNANLSITRPLRFLPPNFLFTPSFITLLCSHYLFANTPIITILVLQ